MKSIKKITAVLLASVLLVSGCGTGNKETTPAVTTAAATTVAETSSSAASESADSHIQSVTVITEVFGDGQKAAAAAVEYDKKIDSTSISKDDYAADGYTVTGVYTAPSAELVSQNADGNYVIVELDTSAVSQNYNAADMTGSIGFGNGGQDSASSGSTESAEAVETGSSGLQVGETGGPGAGTDESSVSGTEAAGSTGNNGGGMQMGSTTATPSNQITMDIAQTGEIRTSDGAVYTGSTKKITTDYADNINLIVDDFKQFTYTADNGTTLMYNLYAPADYATKSYPVVLFMPDATATSTDPVKTLTQGLGAVIWANAENQKTNPCIVLAPQYTGDTSGNADDTDKANTFAVLNQVVKQYNADAKRLYVTGQSAGGIRAIAMMIDQPDLFAGAMLVACQADSSYADTLADLKDQHIWMFCSGGDARALPGMTAIEQAVEGAGTNVTDSAWSAKLSSTDQDAKVTEAEKGKTTINFTVLDKSSMIPDGFTDNDVTEHLNTWRVAYSINGIRSWLFQQSRQ